MRRTVAAVARIEARDPRESDPQHGFESFGAFAQAVRRAHMEPPRVDERLLIGAAAPTTFGSEGVGQDGGFAVPPTWAQQIYIAGLQQEDNLLNYCDTVPVESNSFVFPSDETTPWGSAGVRAFWQAEGGVPTNTKPLLREVTLRANKLIGLVPVTDELLNDASALSMYLPLKLTLSIMWKANEAILNGLGNGTPSGCLNSAAVVVQAKDAGQATLTVSTTNLTNMLGRLPPGSFGESIWLIGSDAIAAVIGAAPAGYPMVAAPPKSDGSPSSLIGLLLGRPAISSQHVAAFSSQGDVSLVDLSYYAAIVRSIGPTTAISLDFAFDADCAYFKTVLRADGASKIVQPIAPAKGAKTLSPFIQLAAR